MINMHSVKNRFLMRMKNITGDLYRRNWFSITVRDVVVVSCCLVREQSSLKAFWYIAKNWKTSDGQAAGHHEPQARGR